MNKTTTEQFWEKTPYWIGYNGNGVQILFNSKTNQYKGNHSAYDPHKFNSLEELESWVAKRMNSDYKLVDYCPSVKKFKDEISDILSSLNYKVEKFEGEYLSAVSVHKWNTEENRIESVNGKRTLNMRFDLTKGVIYLGIKEDGGTRTVFNGTVETEEQLRLMNRLTISL